MIEIRGYCQSDLAEMVDIWNEVVSELFLRCRGSWMSEDGRVKGTVLLTQGMSEDVRGRG